VVTDGLRRPAKWARRQTEGGWDSPTLHRLTCLTLADVDSPDSPHTRAQVKACRIGAQPTFVKVPVLFGRRHRARPASRQLVLVDRVGIEPTKDGLQGLPAPLRAARKGCRASTGCGDGLVRPFTGALVNTRLARPSWPHHRARLWSIPGKSNPAQRGLEGRRHVPRAGMLVDGRGKAYA